MFLPALSHLRGRRERHIPELVGRSRKRMGLSQNRASDSSQAQIKPASPAESPSPELRMHELCEFSLLHVAGILWLLFSSKHYCSHS